MFIDSAQVYVTAGNGGHGGMSFRREKYVPNGGPDGGNGGRGGNVVFMADAGLRTLLPFKYKKKYKADSGKNGTGGRSSGKSGEDLIIKVPLGTVIKDKETGNILFDLNEDGESAIVARGGRGGLGNMNFSSATRQAPRFAQGGVRGEERTLMLELKLIADVGLVGFPNVGKSTFLSSVTAARPKIANYHFTTLSPNLGVVQWKNSDPFVISDIPGIIEGAHQGVGLGIQFLRHVERNRLLLHIIDISGSEGRDPLKDFQDIQSEMRHYNPRFSERKQIIALNKIDLLPDPEERALIQSEFEAEGYEVFLISAATGEGIDALLDRIITLLAEIGEVEPIFEVETDLDVIYRPTMDEDKFTITLDDDGVYVVQGDFLERLINSVNFDDLDSVGYFQKRLTDKGVFKELEAMGIKDEDLVRLDTIEFEYYK
ncbi:GTPase ObgE [Eubacterium aggregans]|uniref:GTPase Obg n=1 Tax=Eubacterium aggregans TaxID=81409 RepID=A0A1H4DC14_9FIRM|nr:GTPase ObgE [Eubacterium aggregans]MDD4690823.1 GTPase ObgE [Eubacterium aggregans]SEA70010.1 GTP-binding protein [Eubacterium aggregans]